MAAQTTVRPTDPLWLVTPEKIEAAVRRIVEVARPSKVVLFGSAARGETHRHSDADFLVVTGEEIEDPRAESTRIREALSEIIMPMDILVISERRLREVADRPGLIYREALQEGKVLYDASA